MQTSDSNYLKVYNESKKHNDINIKNCIYIETKYKYKKHIQHASKQTNKKTNKKLWKKLYVQPKLNAMRKSLMKLFAVCKNIENTKIFPRYYLHHRYYESMFTALFLH